MDRDLLVGGIDLPEKDWMYASRRFCGHVSCVSGSIDFFEACWRGQSGNLHPRARARTGMSKEQPE